MICREYLDNFFNIFLHIKLYICYFTLSILTVNSFLLIMST